MKKFYTVGVSWEMYGYVEVEADSYEDALELAYDCDMPEGSYIEGSWRVDYDAEESVLN
jgi:hypothetical protein